MSKGNKQKRVSPDEEKLLNSLRVVGLSPYQLRTHLENVKDMYIARCAGMVLITPRVIDTLLKEEWGVIR